MLAAIITLGVVCVVLLAIIVRDECTYHSGYKDGYHQGWEDHQRLERARARAGLRSIGIDYDDNVRPMWPGEGA